MPKLKDELNNNKDNVRKLYEIVDKLENLQAELIAIKGFVMAQIYLNSEYNNEWRIISRFSKNKNSISNKK